MPKAIGPREQHLRAMRENFNKQSKVAKPTKERKEAPAVKAEAAQAPAVAPSDELAQDRPQIEPTMEEGTMKKSKAKKAVNGKKANGHRKGGTKSAKAVALLLRPSGTTSREILDALKWPSISVPAFAKTQGLKLRKDKSGDVMRYYGSR